LPTGKSELREQQLSVDGSRKLECAYLFVNLLGNEAGRMIYDGDNHFRAKRTIACREPRLSFKKNNLLTLDIRFKKSRQTRTLRTVTSKRGMKNCQGYWRLHWYDYLRKKPKHAFCLELSGGAISSCCRFGGGDGETASAELGWMPFLFAVET